MNILKTTGGIIHYHEACPNELLPGRPCERIKMTAVEHRKKAAIINYKKIKSYAPGVTHVVVDAKIW
jgi:tRNA wybutosine-synthesizing protein 2